MLYARRARRSLPGLAAVFVLLVSCGLPFPVQAADETDVVPFFGVKGGIGFRGQKIQGQYFRDDVRVGARDEVRNLVDMHVRFGAWYRTEVYLRTSYNAWDRVRWEGINFTGSAPTGGSNQEEWRKGLSDVVVGTRYAILSEARNTGDVSTWTVETNIKIPGSYRLYPTTKVAGGSAPSESPAGTPGFEWLLKTSFSKRIRFADPYISFFYLNRGSASSPADGVGSFNLADSWGTFFGTEIIGFERKADDLRFSGDIGIGWKYVAEGEIPANRFLYGPDGAPGQAPAGFANKAREQRYIQYDGRIGFFYQLQKNVQATGHLTFGLPSEHYIEVYPDSFDDPVNGARIRNRQFTDFGYSFTMRAAF